MIEFLALPFVACLVLTAIHVYLGLHVLARGVIFADLALAQTAALGITVAFLAGHPIQSDAAYWYALVFTLAGAGLFAGSRTRRGRVPQEALIGIVYAVSAAATVLVVDRAPQGSEHIKQLLVGSILTVTGDEVRALALLYAVLGALLWAVRRPLLLISFDPDGAARRHAVRAWDFVFYASFGLVVTSSVRVAGVLLVFSYLVVPATVAALLTDSVRGRLLLGWGVGVGVSAGGLFASYAWDLPTGATVVVTFGASLAGVALARAHAGSAARSGRAAPLRSARSASAPRPSLDSPGSSWRSSRAWTTSGSTGSRRPCPPSSSGSSRRASARRLARATTRSREPPPSSRACARCSRKSAGAPKQCARRRRSGCGSSWRAGASLRLATGWCCARSVREPASASATGSASRCSSPAPPAPWPSRAADAASPCRRRSRGQSSARGGPPGPCA